MTVLATVLCKRRGADRLHHQAEVPAGKL